METPSMELDKILCFSHQQFGAYVIVHREFSSVAAPQSAVGAVSELLLMMQPMRCVNVGSRSDVDKSSAMHQ